MSGMQFIKIIIYFVIVKIVGLLCAIGVNNPIGKDAAFALVKINTPASIFLYFWNFKKKVSLWTVLMEINNILFLITSLILYILYKADDNVIRLCFQINKWQAIVLLSLLSIDCLLWDFQNR